MRLRLGIDENGLGPRLGPMIVTAVAAEVSDEGTKRVGHKVRGKMKERLGDSKALVSHGDIALGEAWARAIMHETRRTGAREPTIDSAEDLIHAISLESRDELQRACPSDDRPQCWGHVDAHYDAEASLVTQIATDIAKLRAEGIAIRDVRSIVVCTKRLNDEVAKGRSRFTTDLHAMERLILHFRGIAGEDLEAVCGKVGGIGKYESFFGPLSGRLFSTLEERRQRSSYRFPGVGDVHFVMDADATDRLVAISSLVGKWMREILMRKISRFYHPHVEGLPEVSGYHDPVTERFVQAIRPARKKLKLVDSCFERDRLGT